MRSGWVLGCVCLVVSAVACKESSGVIIRVHAPEGEAQPTEVQLMIGIREVFDHVEVSISPARGATTSAPQDTRFRASAETWLREDAVDVAAISPAEPAVFVFPAGEHHHQIGAVVAVGYLTGDAGRLDAPLWADAITHVKHTIGAFTVYDLHLRPTVDPSAAVEHRTAPDQLQLWGDGQTCVYYRTMQPLTGGQDHPELFLIGSDTDRDCDGLEDNLDDGTTRECVPSVHLGARLANNDELSCAVYAPIEEAQGGVACMLGGPRCIDGALSTPPGTNTCGPSHYCAPQALCQACIQSTPASACLRDPSIAMPVEYVPRIRCKAFARWTSPDHVGLELCGGTTAPLALSPSLIPSGFTCKVAEIADLDGRFESSLDADTSSEGEDLRVDPDVDAACQLTVEIRGELDDGRPFVEPRMTLLTVDMETDDTRALAMPIELSILAGDAACPTSAAVECHLDLGASPDELLGACLRSAPPPGP